jgi:hypothetical protein
MGSVNCIDCAICKSATVAGQEVSTPLQCSASGPKLSSRKRAIHQLQATVSENWWWSRLHRCSVALTVLGEYGLHGFSLRGRLLQADFRSHCMESPEVDDRVELHGVAGFKGPCAFGLILRRVWRR